ncbi:hypothetical protein [Cryobacterium sp. PH31-L1]|uniref:hypothetical protein n=1 Tax=Cryobacterium sp. PH31-L1 TaxID=3046199 RepID=UPI0024BADE81|nr:hypothetical protein [Cryobacterium sp. PH31-L1]
MSVPAHANTEADPLVALENMGLIQPTGGMQLRSQLPAKNGNADDAPLGQLSQDGGLTVESGKAAVSVVPVSEIDGELGADGKALIYTESDAYSYVLTGEGTAANAGYVVINDASAPLDYQFAVLVDGDAAVLTEAPDGTIHVRDVAGEVVNYIEPAWAKDSTGATVSTHYAIDGNIITQIVNHQGAAYPVVADPGIACDWLFCTYEYSRDQTEMISGADPTVQFLVVAACTAVGGPVGAFACGLSSVAITSAASSALANGKCLGLRKFHTSPFAYPVEVGC